MLYMMVLSFECVNEILKCHLSNEATEQDFPVVLFIVLYFGLLMKSYSVTTQMKATEQYFPVVLFIMLYKVVLTFESVDEILKCDHSNEVSE